MEVKALGHLVLHVGNLERSSQFYGHLLGWRQVARLGNRGLLFSSGRTHHELLLMEADPDAAPIPEGKRMGLQHFAVKIGESDEELRDAIQQLTLEGVPIVGSSDHGVSHSIYVHDPDENEVELYIDVQPEIWRDDPEAITRSIKPLQL